MKKTLASIAAAAVLLLPVTPAYADTGRAGVSECTGGGYYGYYAWYYDLEGDYHRIWTCIYLGP